MVPQRFEVIDRLPLLGSGKADGAALAALPLAGSAGVAPATPEEALLCGIWQQVLRQEVGTTDDFFALGGDSLALLEVVAAAERSGLSLSPDGVLRERTIRAICQAGGLSADHMSAAELREDVAGVCGGGQPEAIFLTGAAGLFGARLLAELLARTRAEVFCLVHARPLDLGHLSPEQARRVHPLAGDLARPRLGLPDDTWASLCRSVGAVYHAGALVHMALPYAALRSANLLGTREVVRLCQEGRAKRLHHISTLSVLLAAAPRGDLSEADDLTAAQRVHGGYAQSKWAAEHLVRTAGLQAAIYRLGLLIDDAPAPPAQDLLARFVRDIIDHGAPQGAAALRLDLTPSGHAAAAVAHLSLSEGQGTFHIANPRSLSLSELVAALSALGQPIAWAEAPPLRVRPADLFVAPEVSFRMERAQAGLAGSGIACPPPDQVLRGYLQRLLRCGDHGTIDDG
jgi:thioester reductase-like protein